MTLHALMQLHQIQNLNVRGLCLSPLTKCACMLSWLAHGWIWSDATTSHSLQGWDTHLYNASQTNMLYTIYSNTRLFPSPYLVIALSSWLVVAILVPNLSMSLLHLVSPPSTLQFPPLFSMSSHFTRWGTLRYGESNPKWTITYAPHPGYGMSSYPFKYWIIGHNPTWFLHAFA
jgi:hypothetical protein